MIKQDQKTYYTLSQSNLLSSKALLILRSVLLALLTFVLINSIVLDKSPDHHFFVFLTWWGVFCGWLYFLLVVIETGFFKNQYQNFSEYVNILMVVILTTEGLIVLFFWTVLWPVISFHDLYFNLQVHAFIYLCLIIDNIVNLVYFRLKDGLYLFIFGVVYIIQNGIVTLYTGVPIYPVLTFKSWMTLVYILLCIIIASIHHTIMMAIYKKFKLPVIIEMQNNDQSLEKRIITEEYL